MDKKKKLATFGLVLLILLYFLPKGLLIFTNPEDVSFDDTSPETKCESLEIQTYSTLENFSCTFTVSTGKTLTINYTLPGISKGYVCTQEGVLLYAYFTSESQSSLVFLDYNLSERWRRDFPAYPLKYTKDVLILVSNPTFGSSGSLMRLRHEHHHRAAPKLALPGCARWPCLGR